MLNLNKAVISARSSFAESDEDDSEIEATATDLVDLNGAMQSLGKTKSRMQRRDLDPTMIKQEFRDVEVDLVTEDDRENDDFVSASHSSRGHPLCDANNNSDSHSHKMKTAKQLLSVIRSGDFEQLLAILRSKPDLNVFINGQTALHYCLLHGNYNC